MSTPVAEHVCTVLQENRVGSNVRTSVSRPYSGSDRIRAGNCAFWVPDAAAVQLVSHFAETAKQLIARSKTPAELTVDISEIIYVDSAGETALTWMRLIGAKFVADTSYSLHLCQRLHLPLTSKRAGLSPNFVFSGAQAY